MEFVKKVLPFVMIISLVSLVLVTQFDMENGLLIPKTINGIKIYTFDLNTYLQRIKDVWTDYTPTLDTLIPSRTIIHVQNAWNVAEQWNALINNMLVMWNWLYFPINIVMWIVQWIAWLGMMLLTAIGMPKEAIIIQFLEFLKTTTTIPYLLMN